MPKNVVFNNVLDYKSNFHYLIYNFTMEVKDLQPALVFQIFDEITKVPRPSKKEGKIRQYLLDFAA